jgi:hypothetical protein
MYGTASAGRAAQVHPITGILPLDPPVLTTRFRQGLDNYAGCTDTMLRAVAPTTEFSSATVLACDQDSDDVPTGDQPEHALIRFENIFGSEPGQVPVGAQIISAKLIAWTDPTGDSKDLVRLHRMLIPWSPSDTWDSLDSGVSANDVEALSAPTFTHIPTVKGAPAVFDVSADVIAWFAGAPNQGWVFLPTGLDGWDFFSAENQDVEKHPTLEIAYTLPTAAGYASWQLAKFGATAGQPGSFPGDDPDFDGGINLLEYALNDNPLRASLILDANATPTTFSFFRNLDATDITIRVETRDDLAASAWSTIATWTQAAEWMAETGFIVDEIAGAVTITTVARPSQRFFRVVVTLP